MGYLYLFLYIMSLKKQDNIVLSVTSPSVYRFSKFISTQGTVGYLNTVCCKFTAESVSDKILKTGYIGWSYRQEFSVLFFFWLTVYGLHAKVREVSLLILFRNALSFNVVHAYTRFVDVKYCLLSPRKAFARDYGITGVRLSVCLFVCYHDN